MDSRNIIFIMLDTVRADMLKPYGGSINVKNIGRLSNYGIKYNAAIAPGTYTLPSHLSIFLGKRVRSIPWLQFMGIRYSERMTDPFLRKSRYVAGRKELTIAQVMEYFGYRSALFSNNPFVSDATGLAAGFSHISNLFIENKLRTNKTSVKAVLGLIQSSYARRSLVRLAGHVSGLVPSTRLDEMYISLRKRLNAHFSKEYGYYDLDKGAAETNSRLESYIRYNNHPSNFIFINYMEGHEGYPTNLFTDRYVEQDKWLHMTGMASEEDLEVTRKAYGKRIEYLDTKVGQAIGMMRGKGMLDNATIIVSSDHGQAFMEHGTMFHNVHPHNEVIRVPLIMAYFRNGRQVREKVEIDKPFSLTELSNLITGRKQQHGNVVVSDHTGITEVWDTQLLRLLKKRSRNAETVYRKKVQQDMHSTAIFHGRYKLIHYYGNRKDELYRIDADPGESFNIIDKNRSVAHSLLEYGTAA